MSTIRVPPGAFVRDGWIITGDIATGPNGDIRRLGGNVLSMYGDMAIIGELGSTQNVCRFRPKSFAYYDLRRLSDMECGSMMAPICRRKYVSTAIGCKTYGDGADFNGIEVNCGVSVPTAVATFGVKITCLSLGRGVTCTWNKSVRKFRTKETPYIILLVGSQRQGKEGGTPSFARPQCIGIVTRDEIMWDDGTSCHRCANPLNPGRLPNFSFDGDSWHIGCGIYGEFIATKYKGLTGFVQSPEYLFATAGDTIAADVAFSPNLFSRGSPLPVELHDIISDYAGAISVTWKTTGVEHAVIRNGITVTRTGLLITISAKCVTTFETRACDMFDNRVVMASAGGEVPPSVFIVDLDNLKEAYTAVPAPAHGEIACGPTSFNIGQSYYSYDDMHEVPDDWVASHAKCDVDIDGWHYHYRNGSSVTHPTCRCNRTCMTFDGVHAYVPVWGRCRAHMFRKGSRVAIVLVGQRGVHLQIHEASGNDLTPSRTLHSYISYTESSFSLGSEPSFFGDGVSVRNTHDEWISLSASNDR